MTADGKLPEWLSNVTIELERIIDERAALLAALQEIERLASSDETGEIVAWDDMVLAVARAAIEEATA